MSKRVADKQLDHFNWNDEDEPEEAGVYKAASEDVLKQRVIKTAKRRMPAKSDGEAKSAFSGFGGFGSSSSNSSQLKSAFSFLSNTNSNGASNASSSRGISFNQSTPSEATKKEETAKISESNTASTPSKKNEDEYLSKLKGLNECFVDWIKEHVVKNPVCILTPILQDYEKYLKEIEALKSSKSSTENKSSENTSGFTFNNASSNPFSLKPPSSANTTGSFSTTKESKTPPNDQKPLPSPFSSTLPNSSSLFKFGSAQTTPSPAMSFGSSSQFSFGKPPDSNQGKEEGEEDEDEEPPKVEFNPVVEEDARYSQRVKVYVKKGEKYNDCGVGTLYLKEVSGKFQAIVRADTSLGNLIFNIIITKDLPCQKLGKNNVMIICHPLPPTADPKTKTIPPPAPVLLKVKTEEEATQLLAEFEKCKK